MKKIFVTIIIAVIGFTGFSQINYKGDISSKNIVELHKNSFKYYTINNKENSVQFYNLDNKLWKSIKLIIPKDVWLDEILHVSTTKINSDSNIEIVYTTYKESYSNVFDDVESIIYDNYTLYIISESGSELLKVKGGRTFDFIDDIESGKMLLIDVYPEEEFFSDYKRIHVYSLD